jgi:hypothetical protein
MLMEAMKHIESQQHEYAMQKDQQAHEAAQSQFQAEHASAQQENQIAADQQAQAQAGAE